MAVKQYVPFKRGVVLDPDFLSSLRGVCSNISHAPIKSVTTALYYISSKYNYGINGDFNLLWQRNAPLVLVVVWVLVVTRGAEKLSGDWRCSG